MIVPCETLPTSRQRLLENNFLAYQITLKPDYNWLQSYRVLLAFLPLTHIFTGYKLPASALTRLLGKDKINMRSQFPDPRLQ